MTPSDMWIPAFDLLAAIAFLRLTCSFDTTASAQEAAPSRPVSRSDVKRGPRRPAGWRRRGSRR
jgi:hypothetical protein